MRAGNREGESNTGQRCLAPLIRAPSPTSPEKRGEQAQAETTAAMAHTLGGRQRRASLSVRAPPSRPTPSSAIPSPTSSPAKAAGRRTTPKLQAPLRRRTSLSVIDNVRAQASLSTLGKRRLEEQEGQAVMATAAFVSEFGAMGQGQSQRGNRGVTALRGIGTSNAKVGITSASAIRLSLATSRTTLPPTTSKQRTTRVDSLASSSPRRSNLPRPCVGPSTPTKAAHVHLSTTATKPLSTDNNVKGEGQQSSVMAREAAWRKLHAPLSSLSREESPSSHPDKRQLVGKTEEGALKREGGGGQEEVRGPGQVMAVPSTRRMSLVQQTARVLRAEETRSRRTSMVITLSREPKMAPARVSALGPSDGTCAQRTGALTSSPVTPEAAGPRHQWSAWATEQIPRSDDSLDVGSMTGALDFIDTSHGSLLMDERMLEELDAEVDRLGLDETTEGALLAAEKGQCRALEKETESQRTLLREMEAQRDEAELLWMQVQTELDEAQRRIAHLEAAQRPPLPRLTRDNGAQTTTAMAIDEQPHRLYREAQARIAALEAEQLRNEWTGVVQLASSQAELLASQADLCRYFNAQLDILQTAALREQAQPRQE